MCILRRASHVVGDSPSFGTIAAGVGQAHAASHVGHGSFDGGAVSVESSAVSVRDDDDARSAVRCAHVGRAEIDPLRIEPEAGKVGEDDVEALGAEPGDVLEDAPLGFDLSDDAGALGPEPPRIVGPKSSASERDRLAGEAAAEDRDARRLTMPDLLDGSESPRVRPVMSEDATAPRIHLGLPRDRAEARTFKPEFEAADAGEQRADGHTAAFRLRATFAGASAMRVMRTSVAPTGGTESNAATPLVTAR
jgi:hypothetical protein